MCPSSPPDDSSRGDLLPLRPFERSLEPFCDYSATTAALASVILHWYTAVPSG
jgi:hypothetical protein